MRRTGDSERAMRSHYRGIPEQPSLVNWCQLFGATFREEMSTACAVTRTSRATRHASRREFFSSQTVLAQKRTSECAIGRSSDEKRAYGEYLECSNERGALTSSPSRVHHIFFGCFAPATCRRCLRKASFSSRSAMCSPGGMKRALTRPSGEIDAMRPTSRSGSAMQSRK